MISKTNLIENYRSELQTKVHLLQENEEKININLNTVKSDISRIEQEQGNLKQKVDQEIDKAIHDLNETRLKLHKKIKDSDKTMFHSRMESKAKLLKEKADILSDITQIHEVMDQEDVFMLKNVNSLVTVPLTRPTVPVQMNLNTFPSLKVVTGSWSSDNVVKLVPIDDHATGYSVVGKIIPADNNEMRGLSVIKNNKYVHLKSLATKNSYFSVIRIKIINDNLYCACGRAGIKVYNKNCDLIKSINHKSIGCVVGMAEYGTGELILTCSETRNIGTEAKTSTPITEFNHHHRRGGLHHMTLEGMYLGPVAEGHFTDVSTYNDIVYGLTVREIQLFQIKTNKWVNVGKIDLNTDYEGYKFGINNEGIYLSTLFLTAYNQIYVYNHEAENTREIVVKPHPQWEPIVCSVDRHSNLLVVDKRSKTVYVYFHDESLWQEVLSVETCSEHEILTDAVVDETGDNIWVATYEKLIKYTRKSEK